MLKTKGIILKKKNINDSDLYLTIFTEDYGKINATSFGIRKSKKKEMFSLNPLSYSEILLTKKGEFYNIVESSLINSYVNIRKNIEKLEISLYILNSVNKVFDRVYEKNIFYYKLLEILNYIDNIQEIKQGYKYYIILTFLRRIAIEEGIYDQGEIRGKLGKEYYSKLKVISNLTSIFEYEKYVKDLKKIVYIFEEYINENLEIKLEINKFLMEEF